MTARAETVIVRDAVSVYLEGQVEAYQRALDRVGKFWPDAGTSTAADWAAWASRLRSDLSATLANTAGNFQQAQAAEAARGQG